MSSQHISRRSLSTALLGAALLSFVFMPRIRAAAVSEMVDQGVRFLLDHMEAPGDHWTDASYGTAEREVDAITALCADALLQAPPLWDAVQEGRRQEAIDKATDFLLAYVPPSEGGSHGYPWAKIFVLEYLLHLQGKDRVPAGRETAVQSKIVKKISEINSTFRVGSGVSGPTMMGHPYWGSGWNGQPAAFLTAPALLVLREAQRAGYSVNVNQRVVDDLARYSSTKENQNDPPTFFAYQYDEETSAPNAAVRTPISETALLDWNCGAASVTRLRTALHNMLPENTNFMNNTIVFDDPDWTAGEEKFSGWERSSSDPTVSLTPYQWLLSAKGHGHAGSFNAGGHFFLIGHLWAAMAIERLPEQERPEWKKKIIDLLGAGDVIRNGGPWKKMRESDGTWAKWNDYSCDGSTICDGSGLNDVAGTAMALLALLRAGAGRVEGTLVNDVDRDGAPEPGEPALGGWMVCLKSGDQTFHQHVATDPSGYYSFPDVPAGDYVVTPLGMDGWKQTYPAAGLPLAVELGGWDGSGAPYNGVGEYGELAFLPHANGVDIVNVSVPCGADLGMTWPPAGAGRDYHDLKMANGVGFFPTGTSGIDVVDLTPLPDDAPVELAHIPGAASGIWIEENSLYIADGQTNLVQVLDVSIPSSPVPFATVILPAGERAIDVFVRGMNLFAVSHRSAVRDAVAIVDMRIPARPQVQATILLETGSLCWATEDGSYLFAAQRMPWADRCIVSVKVWDLTDPCAPAYLQNFSPFPTIPQGTGEPLAIAGSGGFLYASWSEVGTFVFHIGNPPRPDTDPEFGAALEFLEYDSFPVTPRGICTSLGPDRVLLQTVTKALSIRSDDGQNAVVSVTADGVGRGNFAFRRSHAKGALLYADFVAGIPAGWTATGLWHKSTSCPRSGGEAAPAAWAYYGKDVGCSFNNGTAKTLGTLGAPTVAIPSDAVSATLRYYSAYEGEGGVSKVSGKDWAYVAVNGVKVDDVSAAGPSQLNWSYRSVDLAPYIGKSVTITWNFDSRDGLNNTGLGWQVAEVEVVAEYDPFRDAAATLKGTVYFDASADGALGPAEFGLPGMTVFLDRNGNGSLDLHEPSTVTDSQGAYSFTDLFPSRYTVAVVRTPGWTLTAPKFPLGVLRGRWHGSRHYADLWAEGNIAYVGHYMTEGVDLIDISNPDDPQFRATWPMTADERAWLRGHTADIKVKGQYAFIADGDGGGVFIVDVSVPLNPITKGIIRSAAGTDPKGKVFIKGDGFDCPHNIYIYGNYLYEVSTGNPAVKVFDIQNPLNPSSKPDIVTPGVHLHDVTVKKVGAYTYLFACAPDPGKVYIYNVTNIASPGTPKILASGSQTHSCWPTEDGKYLYVTSEFMLSNKVQIWNISTLPGSVPAAKAGELTSATAGAECAHHPRVLGNTLYVAWYRAGILAFDIRDPLHPIEKGRYGTFICNKSDHCNGWSGDWGAHPFLGADRVLASDTGSGLFVLGERTTHVVTPRTGATVQGLDFGLWIDAPAVPGVVYVQPAAAGKNDGTSWTNAYTTLSRALQYGTGSEFWVATGTHIPGTLPTDTFNLRSGNALYGGFLGMETSRGQRNPVSYPTILDGNGYCQHVVKANQTSASTVLDGFIIRRGYSSSGGAAGYGGGLYVYGSITVRNCRFIGNTAQYGAGVYSTSGSSKFIDCEFNGNYAMGAGGGYYGTTGDQIVNCTFTANRAGYWGAGLMGTSFALSLKNCILYGNTGSGSLEQRQVYLSGGGTVARTCIEGLSAFAGNGNISANPLFIDPLGADRLAGTIDDNLRLSANSPCKDAGDKTAIAETLDLGFKPRVVGANVDMGAFEIQNP